LLLAREGGWKRERFLRGERSATGRLWERTAPAELGLSFSRHTLEFLIWITASDLSLGTAAAPVEAAAAELTVGDRLLLFLAYRALRETAARQALWRWPGLASEGLIRLAFPDDFAPDQFPRAEFAVWTTGLGACLLEAFQASLATNWTISDAGVSRRAEEEPGKASAQRESVLQPFFDALEHAGRHDLARFLLSAAQRSLGNLPGDEFRCLAQGARDVQAYLERLRRWERAARSVGYLDEGYAASQLWKAEWEHWDGEELYRRAHLFMERAST
jgi:hypothetical protein